MRASPDRLAWLAAYYAALDGGRYDEAASYLAEDIATRYPAGDEMSGRAALMRVTERSLGRLASIRHRVLNAWEEDDELIFELEIAYERRDGVTIVRTGVGIFVLRDGVVAAQRLFVDMAGVWD
jgi:ketosteroid isomerase-like protein